MIDLTKDISEIAITSNEDYGKAIEMIESGKVFKSDSKDGQKLIKLIHEINNYYHKNFKVNPDKEKLEVKRTVYDKI